MRGSLALILVFAFCGAQTTLFLMQIPGENKELVSYAMGQLSGMVATALAFYFSTTQGSLDKTEMLTKHNGKEEE